MTREERARLGGLAVVKRYGKKHMAAIGRKGFEAAIRVMERRKQSVSSQAQAEAVAWLIFRVEAWYVGDKRNGGRCLSREEWRRKRR